MHEEIIINNKDFNVNYQPIISTELDDIVAVEALIRPKEMWKKETNPMELIHYAEDHFMIDKIDKYVMSQVCHTYYENESLQNGIIFHINLSPIELEDENIVREFSDIADKYEVPYNNIMIELLETRTMDDHRYNVLQQFKDYGFKIGMDDYGTGYSSVQRLMEFEFDCVKISKEMFEKVMANDKYSYIYKKVISALRDTGVSIVQEGIETAYQYDFIKDVGVDMAQGFFVSKAISQKKFIEKMRVWKLAS